MSWRRSCKTSWRYLEDVLKTSFEDVWARQVYSIWSRHFEDVLKTSSEDEDERRLLDVFVKTNICWIGFKILCMIGYHLSKFIPAGNFNLFSCCFISLFSCFHFIKINRFSIRNDYFLQFILTWSSWWSLLANFYYSFGIESSEKKFQYCIFFSTCYASNKCFNIIADVILRTGNFVYEIPPLKDILVFWHVSLESKFA